MRYAGAMDHQYTAVVKAHREGRDKVWIQNLSYNPCRDFIRVWDHLGIMDEKDSTLRNLDIKRLAVPLQARQRILKILHLSHQGI